MSNQTELERLTAVEVTVSKGFENIDRRLEGIEEFMKTQSKRDEAYATKKELKNFKIVTIPLTIIITTLITALITFYVQHRSDKTIVPQPSMEVTIPRGTK